MESFPFLRTSPFIALRSLPPPLSRPKAPTILTKFPLLPPSPSPPSALKSPRGFGPAAKKTQNRKKKKTGSEQEEEEENEDDDDEVEGVESDVTIPEVVTDRMMRRTGLTVGIPLAVGLLFFPFFYYLKVVAKVDVPNWIPFIVSFVFFGTALLGVSYGIVSASWDPLREGSLLGWNEARRNWPVFWDSLRGGAGKK